MALVTIERDTHGEVLGGWGVFRVGERAPLATIRIEQFCYRVEDTTTHAVTYVERVADAARPYGTLV